MRLSYTLYLIIAFCFTANASEQKINVVNFNDKSTDVIYLDYNNNSDSSSTMNVTSEIQKIDELKSSSSNSTEFQNYTNDNNPILKESNVSTDTTVNYNTISSQELDHDTIKINSTPILNDKENDESYDGYVDSDANISDDSLSEEVNDNSFNHHISNTDTTISINEPIIDIKKDAINVEENSLPTNTPYYNGDVESYSTEILLPKIAYRTKTDWSVFSSEEKDFYLKIYKKAYYSKDSDSMIKAAKILMAKDAQNFWPYYHRLFKTAQRLKHPEGCFYIGQCYFAESKYSKALKYYEKSCRMGFGRGCVEADLQKKQLPKNSVALNSFIIIGAAALAACYILILFL